MKDEKDYSKKAIEEDNTNGGSQLKALLLKPIGQYEETVPL